MKVLIVCAQFPYPPRSGFAMRVYQLTRRLAASHDVTLLSYAAGAERDGAAEASREFTVHTVAREPTSVMAKRAAQALSVTSRRPFSSRSVFSSEMQRRIDELCRREHFDVIQLESSLWCSFAFPERSRLVLDEHNIEYEVFKRMGEGERSPLRRAFNRLEYGRFRRFEQRAWSRVHGCVVTSAREVPVVQQAAALTPVAVVPNGVDLDYFRPAPDGGSPRTLVFNGILTYRPNVDAAHHLVDEIWPLVLRRCPDARLTLVGRAGDEDRRRLTRPGVEVVGEVPDIRPYIQRAAVVAVPVRMGGGTRLKVLEGLAMGKAMVSTSLGCEGVDVTDGEHLVVADGAEAFAAQVVTLFNDPRRGAALGSAGRGLIERDYSWDLAARRLGALYAEVVDASPDGAGRELVSTVP